MTKTEIKNLLQLLHSSDSKNALLGINIVWGIEEIPESLQLALGLRFCLDADEAVREEAQELLVERLGVKRKTVLVESFLALLKAHRQRHPLFNQPLYSAISPKEMLKSFNEQRSKYAPIIELNTFYLDLYLRAGIYWSYEVKNRPSEEAYFFFEDVLQSFPHHPYALFGLAKKYEKDFKNPAKAIEAYQCFLRHHPSLSPSEKMMTDYSVSAYLDLPTSFNAYQSIARIFQNELQDYEKALAYYFNAKALVPKHVGFAFKEVAELIWFWKEDVDSAMSLVEEGLTLLARKDLPKAHLFGISPRTHSVKEADLHTLMGDILAEEKQQIDLALMHYKKTLEITRRAMPVRLKQIRLVFNHFKDYWQVESLCNEALKIEPKNFEVLRYLKKAKKGMGR